MESLQGHFLIATSKMPDPRFQKQVLYMCVHNEEGAMGLVVNQPILDISLADIFRNADISMPDFPLPTIYLGGPVEMDSGFVLFSSDYVAARQLAISPTVSLCREAQILKDIADGKGPKHFIFLLGHAGWAPGQLENELTMNGWLTLPAEDDVLFRTPDEHKWKRAAEKHGIDITTFGDLIGTA